MNGNYHNKLFKRVADKRNLARFANAGSLGFDVSVWQPTVDSAYAATKLKFAYIRAMYGDQVDTKFAEHWRNSSGQLKRGAYLYYRNHLDPVRQAIDLYNLLTDTGDTGELPVVVDVETKNNTTLTASRIRACVEKLTELTNVPAMIYTGYYVWRDAVVGDKDWAAAYRLWIAAYPLAGWQDTYPQDILNYEPRIPPPWSGCDIWQWTDRAPGANYGVSSNTVDLDYSKKEFDDTFLERRIKVQKVNEILATHVTNRPGAVYVGSEGDAHVSGFGTGLCVQILSNPINDRYRIARVHPRLGIEFGWINLDRLTELTEPVIVELVDD